MKRSMIPPCRTIILAIASKCSLSSAKIVPGGFDSESVVKLRMSATMTTTRFLAPRQDFSRFWLATISRTWGETNRLMTFRSWSHPVMVSRIRPASPSSSERSLPTLSDSSSPAILRRLRVISMMGLVSHVPSEFATPPRKRKIRMKVPKILHLSPRRSARSGSTEVEDTRRKSGIPSHINEILRREPLSSGRPHGVISWAMISPSPTGSASMILSIPLAPAWNAKNETSGVSRCALGNLVRR